MPQAGVIPIPNCSCRPLKPKPMFSDNNGKRPDITNALPSIIYPTYLVYITEMNFITIHVHRKRFDLYLVELDLILYNYLSIIQSSYKDWIHTLFHALDIDEFISKTQELVENIQKIMIEESEKNEIIFLYIEKLYDFLKPKTQWKYELN